MDKKSEIRKIWSESFRDTPQFVEMYFTRAYDDKNGMLLVDDDGRAVSSLVLQQYPFLYFGNELSSSYIAGAATKRAERGKGYMSELMKQALLESYRRGDFICALIPAHRWLYFFYDKFGFSTIFYVDKQRFTSLHAFAGPGEYKEVDNPFDEKVYQAMARMERESGCGILHTKRDFLNIMDDVNLDSQSRFVALALPDGTIASMAWAVTTHNQVEVRELLGIDADARTAALRALRHYYPDTHFTLLAPPLTKQRNLFARGMGRIVNVHKLIQACASSHPHWSAAIRVSDPIIEENNHIYVVSNGDVSIVDNLPFAELTLDVNIEVLNRIAFSTEDMGSIIGFPSQRPHISLMLD